MNPSHDRQRIEDLKRRLDRREGTGFIPRHTSLTTTDNSKQTSWPSSATDKQTAKQPAWLRGLLLVSFIFFIGALGVAFVMVFKGFNIVSSQQVDIRINGPLAVKAGDVTNLEVVITNNNKSGLEAAELILEYPQGTRSPQDIRTEQLRTREIVGEIAPGQTVSRFVKSVFFGPENAQQEVRALLEYQVKDSNALFEKEARYPFKIGATPLVVSVSAPSETNSGQEIALTLKVTSNSDAPLHNVIILANYPAGFSYTGASVKPAYATKNVWSFGDIMAGESREVVIRGTLEGKINDGRTFTVQAGIGRLDKPEQFDIMYSETPVTVALKAPFLSPTISVAGNQESESIVEPARRLETLITLENTLPNRLVDGQIIVTFKGDLVDKTSVQAGSGFYRSANNTIIWDKTNLPALAVLTPGQKAAVSMTFQTQPLASGGRSYINPVLELQARVSGLRVGEGFSHDETYSVITKRLKISSLLALTSRLVYYDGPFINRGPLPPKVDQETTYTVIWSLTNSSNNVRTTAVKTTLPVYVTWKDQVSPGAEHVSFNPRTREVTWDVGTIVAGAGIGNSPRAVSFQVGFVPSLSQVKTAPVLVGEATVGGVDAFTEAPLSGKAKELSTRLTTDERFEQRQELVVD